MSDKYDQLKKNMKHLSATYSPGILVSTMDGARIAITDLQDEIESLKAITELAVKALEEIRDKVKLHSSGYALEVGILAITALEQIGKVKS